ncbi:MAG TPA: TfoX/Sxy family protein [Dongiaceae bacterium]|jgi:DNA transformation protein|nr:TfoX/Sxy family protein [Dongiaceae bacterium]
MNRPLHLLPGIGPKTAQWLKEVGIETETELRAIGAVDAYCRLKHRNPRLVSRNALWGLHAALIGISWKDIDASTKAHLLAQVEKRDLS